MGTHAIHEPVSLVAKLVHEPIRRPTGGVVSKPWIPFESSEFAFFGDFDSILDSISWEGPRVTVSWNRASARTFWSRRYVERGPAVSAFSVPVGSILQLRMSNIEFSGLDGTVTPGLSIGPADNSNQLYSVHAGNRWIGDGGSGADERLVISRGWDLNGGEQTARFDEDHVLGTTHQLITSLAFDVGGFNYKGVCVGQTADSSNNGLNTKYRYAEGPAGGPLQDFDSPTLDYIYFAAGNFSAGGAGTVSASFDLHHRTIP